MGSLEKGNGLFTTHAGEILEELLQGIARLQVRDECVLSRGTVKPCPGYAKPQSVFTGCLYAQPLIT